MTLYKKTPLGYDDDIPIFSEVDDYVDSYTKISNDHLSSITGDEENPWIKKWVWEQMERGTVQHIQNCIFQSNRSLKILDVGVGLGRLLDDVRKANYGRELNLYGVDISIPYLKVAKKKGINVSMAKIEDMPYMQNYFDIIVCTDVLEHVEDLNLCIKKILYCLSPDGWLIIRVPNREDLSKYLVPNYPYKYSHLRTFDEWSLELLFTRVFRLEIVDKSPGLYYENANLLKVTQSYWLNLIIRALLRFIRFFSKSMYSYLIPYFYYPTEINMVVKK